ncbi:MAG: acyl carrier protein [Candidatus Omnitrophica bacterium]|nr:acyl carrier protein [Candidatus Omnitrophota bacterium]
MAIFRKKRKEQDGARESKRREIFLRIQKVVAEEFKISDPNTITPDLNFNKDLSMDSLKGIELLMSIEQEFGMEIPDEDAEKMSIIKDVVDYLEKKI